MKAFLQHLLGVFAGLALLSTFATAQSRLICQLVPGANPKAVGLRYGMLVAEVTTGAPFALYVSPNDVDLHKIQINMAADPQVVWAEEDKGVAMPEHNSASKGGTVAAIWDRNFWYATNDGMLNQIAWSEPRANSIGREVRVAVLDTGLSPLQPFLWDKVVASINAVNPHSPPFDLPAGVDSNLNGVFDEGLGHGTMVAGLIDQIAPKTKLIVAKVADTDGNGSAWWMIKGLAFSVVHGAEIINISLGSIDRIPALSDVMDWVEERNVLVVAAAGNNNLQLVLAPATISKVVAVSGLNPDDTKASFSNWDSSIRSSAPATGIKSTDWDGGLVAWAGTSFASPMVAASLADALRRIPPQTLDILRQAIEDSGDDLDPANPEHEGKLGTALNFTQLSLWLGAG